MQLRSHFKIAQEEKSKNIYQYDTIQSILKHCEYNTFVVFDLDNTLMESTLDLGSDQWFVKLMEEACRSSPSEETIELVLAIYHAVQHHTKMQAIESGTVRLMTLLQDLNIPVIALTARGEQICKPTIAQLKAIGINFDKQWSHAEYLLDYEHGKSTALFKDGIIFCSGKDKGKCLSSFFESFDEKPKHVLMVDDKEKHLTSVQHVIEAYKGKFTGIRYGFLDEKIKTVDMKRADKQMSQIAHQFPVEAKDAILKIRPDKCSPISTHQVQDKASDEVPTKPSQNKDNPSSLSHPFFNKKKSLLRRNSCPDLSNLKLHL